MRRRTDSNYEGRQARKGRANVRCCGLVSLTCSPCLILKVGISQVEAGAATIRLFKGLLLPLTRWKFQTPSPERFLTTFNVASSARRPSWGQSRTRSLQCCIGRVSGRWAPLAAGQAGATAPHEQPRLAEPDLETPMGELIADCIRRCLHVDPRQALQRRSWGDITL